MKKLLALVLCALVLSACGDAGLDLPEPAPDEALKMFEEQEIAWEACDPILFEGGFSEAIEGLGDRLECATLKTPLDWEEPARDDINLGILRVKAADESKRKGAIFMNPGGPGGDGLRFAANYGLIFATANSDDPRFPSATPEEFAQVSEQYDIIGFSPRGVGSGFRLICSNAQRAPKFTDLTNRSEENIQAILDFAKVQAEACKNNPLSDFIDSGQTVQDMDLIRRLLGDEKLNYIGGSYGAWLGSWYAKQFPENTGNMVITANTDFSATIHEVFSLQPLGMQRAFEDVVAPYIARNDAVFELGTDAEAIVKVADELPDYVKLAFRSTAYNLQFNSAAVGGVGVLLSAAKGVSDVLQTFETPLTEDTAQAFFDEVSTYTYNSNEEVNEAATGAAVAFAEVYLDFLFVPNGELALDPSAATNQAVKCNDSAASQDPQFWVDLGNEEARAYPLFGGSSTLQPCAFWGEPSAEKPQTPEDIPPILMVQSGYDAATPVEGAFKAFESLPNASFVYVENEMEHGIFPYGTECVDAKVAQYLLDGTLPEETISNCDALPLPGETEVFAPGTAPSLGNSGLQTQGVVQAAKSAGDNALYDYVRDLVNENAADFYGY